MASLNRVVLVGNLTRDPELKFTTAGKPVARLGLAVNRQPYTNDAGERIEGVDFFNIVVFGRQAETANQYLRKGAGVAIDGRLRGGRSPERAVPAARRRAGPGRTGRTGRTGRPARSR
jgi:single-strand DNA-binding protein